MLRAIHPACRVIDGWAFGCHDSRADFIDDGIEEVRMDIAMVGLGKMGANMAQRLLEGGHRVVAFDLSEESIREMEAHGAEGARTLDEVVEKLAAPRVVWVMVPSGKPVESAIEGLGERLSAGDVVVDGGNSNYRDSMQRAEMLKEKGIHFVDVGTSGGVWGLTEGYSLMVGGEAAAVEIVRPALETLAPNPAQGWGHVGPSGAGHFVKMVHNGIEYGMMQAYAEGFELMDRKEAFGLDLGQIANIWRFGSVVRSWLLDLTAQTLRENPTLEGIAAYVPDSGEGRWTVVESIDLKVPIPVITLALQQRFRSRQDSSFAAKLLSAMRGQFGGHKVKKEG
jgi:6-phosphogluconate dehydrogenase